MPERARSFGAVAAAYARHRPGYPAAALDWALAPAPGGDVLDLGAGTGKVTEALLRRPGVRVTAVDPDPAMLAQFRADFPTVDAHEGSAERIPLAAAAVDAVVVGTAWHWFDRADRRAGDRAGAAAGRRARRALERRRRLRRMGARLPARAAPRGAGPGRHRRSASACPTHPAFGASETRRFANPVPTTIDGFVETIATHSWALIADPVERDASLARMRAYLAERPETSPGAFTLPMVTEVVRTLRR